MKRWLIGIAAGGSLIAASAHGAGPAGAPPGGLGEAGRAALAHWLAREDVDAFIDARIAALHAGLRLSSEQEKLWPPLETAMRKVVERLRKDMGEWPDVTRRDLPALLRGLADRQAASADMLRELADALTPLYATFDDAQKRRFRRWLWTLPMHGLAIELMMPDL